MEYSEQYMKEHQERCIEKVRLEIKQSRHITNIINVLKMIEVKDSIENEKYTYGFIYPSQENINILKCDVFRLHEKYLLLEMIYGFIKKNRFALINEELIQKAMSPARLMRHLELGGDIEDF